MKHHPVRLSLLCALVLLAGCRTAPYEGRYGFYEGWRKGVVTAVRPLNELGWFRPLACHWTTAPPTPGSGASVAVIRHRLWGPSTETWIVFEQPEFQVHDRVYINLESCPARVVARAVD